MIIGLLLKIVNEMVLALPWTIALTVVSFLIGAIFAIPICWIRKSRNPVLSFVAQTLILGIRSIPPILWLFIIFFGFANDFVSLSPFTSAVIGLGLISAANIAEIYRGAMQAVPVGQYEATRALGLPFIHQYVDVLVPQIFRLALPSLASYMIGLLKDTAVASTIGVHEMALSAFRISQETFRGSEVYAAFGTMYFLLSIGIAYVTRGLDKRLRERIAR
jgi:polar amino acid transport system permease protein